MKYIIPSVFAVLVLAVNVLAAQKPNILLLMSDNQSHLHAGCYADKVVQTPNIDQLAKNGVRFTHAFCAAPSCSPARAAMLTGRDIWQLEDAANLYGPLQVKFQTYTDLLEKSGYACGMSGKGWGPGNFRDGGRSRNPGGEKYQNFQEFLTKTKTGQPWTFWFSSREPHRPYPDGTGEKQRLDRMIVPPYLPDSEEVRKDIDDYYTAVEQFDTEVGEIIGQLKTAGQYENTVIVVCSDNGWQMPRGLANLYDSGMRVPLIMTVPNKSQGVVSDALVSLNDLAPTFLELAGVPVPEEMTAKSLVPLLNGEPFQREFLAAGRERHAFARHGGLGYPGRSLRTRNFLYIRNFEPDREPAGDPPLYGDTDAQMLQYKSPAKVYILEHSNAAEVKSSFALCFGKRPAEELYDLRTDAEQVHNVADKLEYRRIKEQLSSQLSDYLTKTGDPRLTGKPVHWDTAPYSNDRDKTPRPSKEYQHRLGLNEEYDLR
ncbi:MAG: sulfatase [Planctomycetaceae bacterium]|jgi:arylsulfatase A-like enzyme|nr:sulfatase [Planctomycetaceae bacterium]